jgi:hypothetical protein
LRIACGGKNWATIPRCASRGARFTKIPYTVIDAEAKWAQQHIALFEEALEQEMPADPFSLEPAGAFLRYADTEVRRQTYTVGFNTSPVSRLTISAKFSHGNRLNIYDHLVDEKEGAAESSSPSTATAHLSHGRNSSPTTFPSTRRCASLLGCALPSNTKPWQPTL